MFTSRDLTLELFNPDDIFKHFNEDLPKLSKDESISLENPLSESEIKYIQSQYSKKLPSYFINFLRKIGLKQDFVWGVLGSTKDFKDLGEFLPSEDYFQFGDGNED